MISSLSWPCLVASRHRLKESAGFFPPFSYTLMHHRPRYSNYHHLQKEAKTFIIRNRFYQTPQKMLARQSMLAFYSCCKEINCIPDVYCLLHSLSVVAGTILLIVILCLTYRTVHHSELQLPPVKPGAFCSPTANNSTSKFKSALGGIAPGAPSAP